MMNGKRWERRKMPIVTLEHDADFARQSTGSRWEGPRLVPVPMEVAVIRDECRVLAVVVVALCDLSVVVVVSESGDTVTATFHS